MGKKDNKAKSNSADEPTKLKPGFPG